MKIIIDALPSSAINLLTTCWPAIAAQVATKAKYAAAEEGAVSILN